MAKTTPTVSLKLSDWVALCEALDASPDTDIRTIILKVERLIQAKTKYAREVVVLEGKLTKRASREK